MVDTDYASSELTGVESTDSIVISEVYGTVSYVAMYTALPVFLSMLNVSIILMLLH